MIRGMSDVMDNSGAGPAREAGAAQVAAPPAAPQTLRLAEERGAGHRRPAVSEALQVRIWCAFTLALCAGMLGVGLFLNPEPQGHGTHQQLGLQPCGWYQVWGFPCLTCGCTTAVSHFSHGHWVASFLTQPFGFVVALVALILVPLTGWGLATGKWKGPSMFWLNWYWTYWVFGSVALLVVSWIYKIIIARQGG
jgi:hypothetical protein